MVNYGNSMIYKLCCKDPNITDIYIGSTTNFSRRKSQHKIQCNNEISKKYNFKVYTFIRDNGGFENWDMVLIENVSCENKRDLEKIERDYIDKLKPTLNTNRSYRSSEEKQQYYKEYSKEYNKQNQDKIKAYYKENTTKILEHQRQYYQENKDKISEHKKEYRKKNKDKIKEYHKKYYQNKKNNL